MFTMADISDPGMTVITGVDVIALYIGGFTPHVWTSNQIRAQTVPLMLPIWVYDPNKPGSATGTSDAQTAVSVMKSFGIPTGVRVVIDMETRVDTAYISAFRGVIANAGYWTTIYGSASTVFGNWSTAVGPGGGWWVADWTDSPHLYGHAGVWATQYHNGSKGNPVWDQSSVSVLDHLWPHIPASFSLSVTVTDAKTLSKATQSAHFTVKP